MTRFRRSAHIVAPIAALALTGCAPPSGATTGATARSGMSDDRRLDPFSTCAPEAARDLLQRRADAATLQAARRAAGAASVRVIRPGDAYAQDYQSSRLNVEIDTAGNIVRFFCG